MLCAENHWLSGSPDRETTRHRGCKEKPPSERKRVVATKTGNLSRNGSYRVNDFLVSPPVGQRTGRSGTRCATTTASSSLSGWRRCRLAECYGPQSLEQGHPRPQRLGFCGVRGWPAPTADRGLPPAGPALVVVPDRFQRQHVG